MQNLAHFEPIWVKKFLGRLKLFCPKWHQRDPCFNQMLQQQQQLAGSKNDVDIVLDCDKELSNAIENIFLDNHATNCIQYIKENVKNNYGQRILKLVFLIARSCTH